MVSADREGTRLAEAVDLSEGITLNCMGHMRASLKNTGKGG